MADLQEMLLVKAALDNPDLNKIFDEFYRLTLSQGRQVKLLEHKAGQHAFDILDDNAESRQIIAETIEFIRTYI